MLHVGIDPKVAAAVLGHSNVMLFWNTYSHVTQNLTAQAGRPDGGIRRTGEGREGCGSRVGRCGQ
jgi:hypothetical protein